MHLLSAIRSGYERTRIEYALRNAARTALMIKDATLYNLLNDPDYCKGVVQTLENKDLQNFWKNELGKAGGFQQVKMVAGLPLESDVFSFLPRPSGY